MTDSTPHHAPRRPLTSQQERVVDGLCRGWGNATIAAHMGISVSTLKGHLIAIDHLFSWDDEDPRVSRRERIRMWGMSRQLRLKEAG